MVRTYAEDGDCFDFHFVSRTYFQDDIEIGS